MSGGFTENYAAPELLHNLGEINKLSKANFSSDIYSLSCVLNFVLTGV